MTSKCIGGEEIRKTMEKVGLNPDYKTKVDSYSLGTKQKFRGLCLLQMKN